MEPAVESALIGRQLGEFRLREIVGVGGMATAYLADQASLSREAVVKILERSAVSSEQVARFLRESRLASRLDHPYAAHIYAFGAEPDGLLWIAMEVVRGVALDRLIDDQGPLPLARFVAFFERLCEVVFTAHEAGIVHRDIKPSNVICVFRAGRLLPKLLDFGIARALSGTDEPVAGAPPLESMPASVTTTATGILGSMPYMAPEQWVDASRADARTDQYALAITAYEVLTGRLPFAGRTAMDFARHHARTALPPFEASLPIAVHNVLSRAAAKHAKDRFPDVLTFASALREAARTEVSTELAGIDEVVAEAYAKAGPRPIVECLMVVEAARGPAEAWSGIWKTAAALVRTVALTALAIYRQRAQPHPAAEAALRRLSEHGLDLAGWAELAATLVAPFDRTPSQYPIPELVELFWDAEHSRAPFGQLLPLQVLSDGDGIDIARVRAAAVELSAALRACSFTCQLAWIWATSSGVESWAGPRRHPAVEMQVSAPPLAPGSVWIGSRDGAPLVELSPFVELSPPTPGVDDEVFMLDGPGRRHVRMVSWPHEFERASELADVALGGYRSNTARLGAGKETDVQPFRGLAAFQSSDAGRFFGREGEVEGFVNRLRVQPMLAVVGPSGVGKSSFIQAGVVPALPASWQVLTFRPGSSPIKALAARLVQAGMAESALDSRLRSDPGELKRLITVHARRLGVTMVLVVDQLEEIFTQCRDAEEIDAFARVLASIDEGATIPARVIFTLRDDFLVRTAELPVLGAHVQRSLTLLTLPNAAALERTLVEPLRQIGYAFEDRDQPAAMVTAVHGQAGALALLSFAAARLWEQRDRQFRHIPRRAYQAIGGVVGALAQHAEATLTSLSEPDRSVVRELFRHLLTSEGTRALLNRDEAMQVLGGGANSERIIEVLLRERLLVTSDDGDGDDRLELIHEALVTAWPRLADWLREDAESARMRHQLRATARQWEERGKSRGMLWRGDLLAEYTLWRKRAPGALTALETEFANASTANETRLRRIRRALLVATLLGLSIGLIIVQRANRTAERNADELHATNLAIYAEQGRQAIVQGRPDEALVYLAEALRNGLDTPDLRFLLGVATRALGGQLATLPGSVDGVETLSFSADGSRLAVGDDAGAARTWETKTWQLVSTITARANGATVVELDSNGGRVVVSGSRAPEVFDTRTGQRLFALDAGTDARARWTRDGRELVAVEYEHPRVQIFDASDGHRLREITADAFLGRDTFALGDRRFAIAVKTGVLVGDLEGDGPTRVLSTSKPPRALDLNDRANRVLAVVEASRTVAVWDLNTGTQTMLAGHTGDVLRAKFSPDGARVATTSLDRTARIWDAATGAVRVSLEGHGGYVLPVQWSPDGQRIATGSADRTARVWDAEAGTELVRTSGDSDIITAVAFSPDGKSLAVGSADTLVHVVNATARPGVRQIAIAASPTTAVFSGDSRRLLALGETEAAVFDVSSGDVIARMAATTTANDNRILAFESRRWGDLDVSGSLAVVPSEHHVELLDVSSGTIRARLGPVNGTVCCAHFVSAADVDRVIAGASDGALTVWRDGRLEHVFKPHASEVKHVALDRAGTRAAVSYQDGNLVVIDLTTGAATQPRAIHPRDAAFDRAGERIGFAADDAAMHVISANDGHELTTAKTLADSVAFDWSQGDTRVAVSTTAGMIDIDDAKGGAQLAEFGDGQGFISGVAFSPDGRLLAATSDLGRLSLFDVLPDTRVSSEVDAFLACRVPWRIIDNHLRPIPATDLHCKTP